MKTTNSLRGSKASEEAIPPFTLLLLLARSWHDAPNVCLPSLVIALDIAGAFDCVWHCCLFAKVVQLGVAGDLLYLFPSYLIDRSLWATVNTPTSASVPGEVLFHRDLSSAQYCGTYASMQIIPAANA